MPKPTQTLKTPFKKTLAQALQRLQEQHPEAVVELWAFDEHRLGLLPLLRRVWAPTGQRPTVLVEPRFQWLYLYGFVQPQSGRTHFVGAPTSEPCHA